MRFGVNAISPAFRIDIYSSSSRRRPGARARTQPRLRDEHRIWGRPRRARKCELSRDAAARRRRTWKDQGRGSLNETGAAYKK